MSKSVGPIVAAILAVIVVVLLPIETESQQRKQPRPPAQFIEEDPALKPLTLADPDGQGLTIDELEVRTAISGMLALTEIEVVFRNPQDRRIEGRFDADLPADAAISRFAKEVNGRLMEGEVVERLRANQVYEQFLHQMRDPALLEQDQGNRFSARIFPIEPRASVRILLSYTQLLPVRDGRRRWSYPLKGLDTIGRFSFRATLAPLPGEGGFASQSDLQGLTGGKVSTNETVSLDEKDYRPDRDLELTWRAAEENRAQLIRSSQFYLASLRLPDTPMQSAPPVPLVVYIDTSASAAPGAEHRIRAIEQFFRSLPPDLGVEAIAFDLAPVPLASGRAASVSAQIESLLTKRRFLGGTNLSAVLDDIAKRAASPAARHFVLISDGVATYGETAEADVVRIVSQSRVTRLDAVVIGPRQAAVLERLTTSRGRIIEIPLTGSVLASAQRAATELLEPLGESITLVDDNSEWVYPSTIHDLRPGREVFVLAKLKAGREPELRVGRRGGAISFASGAKLQSGGYELLLEREANRAYLEYLGDREAAENDPNVRAAIARQRTELSIQNRILIPSTTLLVLETEADYQRFNLDRRSLASILVIGAGGVEELDRSREIETPRINRVDVPRERRRQVTPPAVRATPVPVAPPRDERQKAENESDGVVGGVESGVEGGVVGGVVGGSPAFSTATPVPTAVEAPPDAFAEDAVRESAVPPPPAPPPPPDMLPQVAPSSSGAIGGQRSRQITRPMPESRRIVAEPESTWTRQQKPVDTSAELEAAIRNNPTERTNYTTLSELLFRLKDWRRLRELALRWQPYDPENPQVYEMLGEAAFALESREEAIRAWSSIAEVAASRPELLQRAGLLLLRAKSGAIGEAPLRKAVELRPDRVNPHRHLALYLWKEQRFAEAADVLEAALSRTYMNWYGDVHRVLREELGYVYRAWGQAEPRLRDEIVERAREHGVELKRLDALRVTLAWETDANDVDLHVVDPAGEESFYSHPRTASGLELYGDVTQGLGPEVIRTSRAVEGTYSIGVNYFNAGPMGVSRGIVTIIRTDAKRSDPEVEIIPFRLVPQGAADERGDVRLVGKVKF